MQLRLCISAVLLVVTCLVNAQTAGESVGAGEDAKLLSTATETVLKTSMVAFEGDSIPYMELGNVYVYPVRTFASKRQSQAYARLVRDVKRVMPIAKTVNSLIIETYEYLETLPTEKAKREHLKLVEKNVLQVYKPQMRKLTFTQGKLLIKLIHRECNSSSYEIVQAFLGPVKAGFYQAFAAIFGASLRKKYDAEGDDKMTEQVILMVESGQL